MAVVKRVGVLSFAKIYSLMFSLIGLLEGSLLAYTYATNPQALQGAEVLRQLGYWGILVMPLVYALIGFAIGTIVSWVYNQFAKWVGGIEVDLVLDKKPK